MALIKCPECGNEVSDKSVKCVNCGYPISEKQNNNFDTNPVFILQKSFNKRLLLIIPAVLILIIIILVAAGKSQAEIDQEYSNTILGSWNFNHQMKSSGISEKTGTKFNVETNFTLKESIVYLKNHTFISGQELVSVIMKNNKTYKTSLSIVNKGSWQINNGKYIEKIVNSSQVPVDKESQLVLEKNPELFKFLENDGQPIVREIVELDEKKLQ